MKEGDNLARKRMIDPNIWMSEDVGKLSLFERLLLIGMFSNADDEGKGRANPPLLRSIIFPYDDISVNEINGALEKIKIYIKIEIYEVDGSRYYKFLNWKKWQRVEKPQKSIIPEPFLESFHDFSPNDSTTVPRPIGDEEKRREEKGREDNIKEEKEDSLSQSVIEILKYFETLKPGQNISAQKDAIRVLVDMYSFEWVKDALQETIKQKGKFIQPYMEKILKNWQSEGKENCHGPTTTDNRTDKPKYNVQVDRELPDLSGIDTSEFGEL